MDREFIKKENEAQRSIEAIPGYSLNYSINDKKQYLFKNNSIIGSFKDAQSALLYVQKPNKMNKGTTKIKAIAKRALEIREKGGFKTETITKKRYNVAYIPDAIKQAAKELKSSKPAPAAKRTKRIVKTKIAKNSPIAKRKAKRTGTNSKSGVKVIDKNVSVSAQTAIADVLTLSKYSNLKPMYAGVLFSNFEKSTKSVAKEGEMKFPIYSKLEDVNYLELVSSKYIAYKDINEYKLTEAGKAFIKSVKARIETLKGKKYGYELFDN